MRLFLCLLAAIGLAAPAGAQSLDYKQRERDLTSLAEVFGALHHIRRTCNPAREADIWRDRMKRVIDLEEPQPALRETMVSAFNDAYRAAQSRYPTCNRDARDHAAARAMDGETYVRNLAEPLYEALESDPGLPNVMRGIEGR